MAFWNRPSFRGADLRAQNLSTLPLAGADLREADLRGMDLSGLDLRGADLSGAHMEGARLVNTDLRDADLNGASLEQADASGADLRRTVGFGVVARGLLASGARFDGAEWRHAILSDARMDEVQGTAWRLDGAVLTGTRFFAATLRKAVLDDAALDGADFSEALLMDAAFDGAYGSARFVGADLRGADLRCPAIVNAILDGARLRRSRILTRHANARYEVLEAGGWRAPIALRIGRGLGEQSRYLYKTGSTWVNAWQQERLKRAEVAQLRARSDKERRTQEEQERINKREAEKKERERLAAERAERLKEEKARREAEKAAKAAEQDAAKVEEGPVTGVRIEPALREVDERLFEDRLEFPADAARRDQEQLGAALAWDMAARVAVRLATQTRARLPEGAAEARPVEARPVENRPVEARPVEARPTEPRVQAPELRTDEPRPAPTADQPAPVQVTVGAPPRRDVRRPNRRPSGTQATLLEFRQWSRALSTASADYWEFSRKRARTVYQEDLRPSLERAQERVRAPLQRSAKVFQRVTRIQPRAAASSAMVEEMLDFQEMAKGRQRNLEENLAVRDLEQRLSLRMRAVEGEQLRKEVQRPEAFDTLTADVWARTTLRQQRVAHALERKTLATRGKYVPETEGVPLDLAVRLGVRTGQRADARALTRARQRTSTEPAEAPAWSPQRVLARLNIGSETERQSAFQRAEHAAFTLRADARARVLAAERRDLYASMLATPITGAGETELLRDTLVRVEVRERNATARRSRGGALQSLQQSRLFRTLTPRSTTARPGPGSDLSGQRLDDAKWAGVDLTGAKLARASLVGADLRWAKLENVDLRDADLTAARLTGARLDGAILEGTIFDQAVLDQASFRGTLVRGARMASARGLATAARQELRRAGADFGDLDTPISRTSYYLSGGALAAGVALYMFLIYQTQDTTDPGSLEHAAAEAQRTGENEKAVENFTALAEQQTESEGKVSYLLEAAAAAREANNTDAALSLLEQALEQALGGPQESNVRLKLAEARGKAGLTTQAAVLYREMIERIDLTPTERSDALVGLGLLLGKDGEAEIKERQNTMITTAATDLERTGIALALADGWSGANKPEIARAVVELTEPLVAAKEEKSSLRVRLARLLVEQGDADAALAIYKDLLDGPRDGEARLGAAELLMRQGKDDEATELLEPLLKDGSEDEAARARILQGMIAERAGDFDLAISLLQEVLKQDLEANRLDEARMVLGRLLIRSDPAAAAALISENPDIKEELLLGQARVLRESGKRLEARELWVRIIEDPAATEDGRTEAELSLAEMEVDDGEFEGALRRYDRLMEQTTALALRRRIQLGMSDTLLRMGNLQEAEARYDALLSTVKEGEIAVQCRVGLARAAELRGQVEKATRLYLEVGRTEGPWAVEALLSLGKMRERTGDLTGAVEAYRLARQRPGADTERMLTVDIAMAQALDELQDPEAARIYANLLDANDPVVRVKARVVVGERDLAKDPEGAKKSFQEALDEAAPGEDRAKARAGWLRAMIALGETSDGVEQMNAWLSAESDTGQKIELALLAIKALRAEGRLEEADAVADRYAEDGGFEVGMERAEVLRELGNPTRAAEVLAALEATTVEDRAWLLETRGQVLLEAEDYATAEKVYAALAEIPGTEASVQIGRARLFRAQERYDEALAVLADSTDDRAPLEKALILDRMGRKDEAEVMYRSLMESADLEQRSAGTLGVARILLERDAAAGAIQALDTQAALADGYKLDAAQVRGEALRLLGNFDEARLVYQALTGDAESRIVGALGLGEIALAEDKLDDAEAQFKQVRNGTEDPFYQAMAFAGEVRVATERGDADKAKELLEYLQKKYPDQEDAIGLATGVK